MALLLREDDVTRLLSMADALTAVEKVFRFHGCGDATNMPRSRVRTSGGMLHVMSGGVTPLNVAGLKTYTTTRQGARFAVLLFQADTGALLAIIEADRLGQLRTGAASGVATKYMARTDTRTVGIVGTGWQARSQLAAVCGVRDIELIRVFGRDETRRLLFCREMSETLGLPVLPAESTEEAVRDADVVITVTSAREPVLMGRHLKPGAHINAAGSNALDRREIDKETVRRAKIIAVDAKDQARIECGDLVEPIAQSLISWDAIHELGDIVAGRAAFLRADDDITLFESHGLAIQDLAVAAFVYTRARENGAGIEIPGFEK
ncbi:MAG: ornithine cyclodeaminase family protein [candidate division Zixibacteria bacterium]|nr:ornithine cyclodeaminase family protein [candidate division Zixibacteria bacterium]